MRNEIIKSVQQLLDFLKSNPAWLSGYICGEGCFTGSFYLDTRAKWVMWPQLEFNITQLFTDVKQLYAINAYFGNTGSVSERKNGVGSVSFRKLKVLRTIIDSFCTQHPLIGNKSISFNDWLAILELVEQKTYLGDDLAARDHLVAILVKLRDLNARSTRSNARKLARNQTQIDWLNSLNGVPTLDQKKVLVAALKPKKNNSDTVEIDI
jgi:hypothetical protein